MELALYGPGGYYEEPAGRRRRRLRHEPARASGVRHVRGAGADDARGRPRVAGASARHRGRGGRRDAGAPDPDASSTPPYTAVEISAGARRALAAIDGLAVRERLAAPVDLVLAHELLDNLPFRLVRDGREVADRPARATQLIERPAPIDDELAAVLLGDRRRRASSSCRSARSRSSTSWPPRSTRGYALLIDYGGEAGAGGAAARLPRSPGRRGRAARARVRPTSRRASTSDGWRGTPSSAGLQAFPTVRQHDALLGARVRAWFREELARQQEQLASGRGPRGGPHLVGALARDDAGRSRARSAGCAGWCSPPPGLPEPAWLRAARDRRTD